MPGTVPNIQYEEYYQLVADNINDLVALYTIDGRFSYLSPSVYRVLGYNRNNNFIGGTPDALIHPADLHLLKHNFKLHSTDPTESVTFEYRLKHSNGNWIYFDSYRKPIRDEDGKLVGVLAVCRDISNRKQAEREIRASEMHYRMLADNIIDMVTMYDVEGTLQYVSPSCYSLLGYNQEELIGNNIRLIINPEDLVRLDEEIRQKTFKGVDKFISEARLQHKNGTWLYCETTTKAIKDKTGKLQSFVCTTRDITEWKLAQVALKENEEKYRSLVEASDALIAVIDLDGKFLFVNDKRAAYFKKPKHEIVGRTIYEFYPSKDTDDLPEKICRVKQNKTSTTCETFVTLNGQDLWLRVTLHPILDANDEVTSILINTIDITNIKTKEAALRVQNDELKQIAFLQSHIVRSPLSNIQGLLALMESDELQGQQAYYLSLLKQAAAKLDIVVNEIVQRAVAVRHNTDKSY